MEIETKIIEVNDKSNFFPVMVIKILKNDNNHDNWLIEMLGLPASSRLLYVMRLEGYEYTSLYYSKCWNSKVTGALSIYLNKNWDEIKTGDLLEIEGILKVVHETKERK